MEAELPKPLIAQMYTNLMLDFGIGFVPVIGDLADAWFKCNTRNNLLLEKFLRERGLKHPVAAPPPHTKQSTMRRFFGAGPHAPGSHPAGKYSVNGEDHSATSSDDGVGSNVGGSNAASGKPALPARNPPRQVQPAYSNVSRERDLEAQIEQPGQIHYTREL